MFLPRAQFIRMTRDYYGVLKYSKYNFEIILKQSETHGLQKTVSISISTQNTWT